MFKNIKKIIERMINMFNFTKNSGLVKVWVSLIVGGTYVYEQCPALFNLKECVGEVLKEVGFVESKEDVTQ